MFETTRFEARQRLTAAAGISLALAAFAAMVLLIAPGVVRDIDVEALLAQLPPALVESFGLAQMGTVEGFLALELYQFIWTLGLGCYLAYLAAGTIAGDIEADRLDTLLAAPISRRRLLVEKYLALLAPILIVDVVVFAVVAVGSRLVAEPIALVDLLVVHGLAVPYLLACGAFGLVTSVVASRLVVAEGVAVGAIIGSFLLRTLVSSTDLSWLGHLAPMAYYDPLTILTRSQYDLTGGAILVGVAAVLLAGSVLIFEEVDVP